MAEASLIELAAVPTSTPAERRLRHEWQVLKELVRLNPTRLSSPRAVDSTFLVTLRNTPALDLEGFGQTIVDEHLLRLEYPRFFPAVPLELYLDRPMVHPNIHPVTGFVCLWLTHRVEHSVEHALHRVVAILGWQLMNLDARHVMQPECLAATFADVPARLATAALRGIDHSAAVLEPPATTRRRRLS